MPEKFDNAMYISFTETPVAYSAANPDEEYIFDYDKDGNLVGAELLTAGPELVNIDIPDLQKLGKELSKGKLNAQTMGGPPQGNPPPDMQRR